MSPLLLKIAEGLPGFSVALTVLCLLTGTRIYETSLALMLLSALAILAQLLGSRLDPLLYNPLFGADHIQWPRLRALSVKQDILDKSRDAACRRLFEVDYKQAKREDRFGKFKLYTRCVAIASDGPLTFVLCLAISKAARTLFVICAPLTAVHILGASQWLSLSSSATAALARAESKFALLSMLVVLLIAYIGGMYVQHMMLYKSVSERAVSHEIETGELEWWIPKAGTTTPGRGASTGDAATLSSPLDAPTTTAATSGFKRPSPPGAAELGR